MTNACREIDEDCANWKVCIALLDLRLLSRVTSPAAKIHIDSSSIARAQTHTCCSLGGAHEYQRCIQLYYRESAAALCLAYTGRQIALSTAPSVKGEDRASGPLYHRFHEGRFHEFTFMLQT